MIVDMSEAGMRIVTGPPCREGEQITVIWRFDPSEEPFEIECSVRHLLPINPPDQSLSLGLKFLNLSSYDRLRILEFLSRSAVAPI